MPARGLPVDLESEIRVRYNGTEVGLSAADWLGNEVVVVEVKAATSYNTEDEAPLLNEIKASGMRVGRLIDFGRAHSSSSSD